MQRCWISKRTLRGRSLLVSRAKVIENQVMADPIISISSDSSEESVGSHAPRVILFGVIPAIIPVIPEVPIVPADPIVTPEVGTVSVVSPVGDPVSSSHLIPVCTIKLKFPLAPVVAPTGIRRCAPSDLSLSVHTPPGHHRLLCFIFYTHRLFIDHLLGLQNIREAFSTLEGMTPLSTPYPPTTSESSLGSSSERSLDSSSPSPESSCKRCRSLTASVPSSTHVSRSIAPTPTDPLPPRKRFRDSYSPKDSGEEHMEVDTPNAKAVADVGISKGVIAHPEDGVGMGFEIASSDVMEDDEEFEVEASATDTREIAVDLLTCQRFVIDRITEIEITQRPVGTSQNGASGERRSSLVDRGLEGFVRTMTITRSGMTPEVIEELVNRRVEEALAAHEVTRAANALEAENQIHGSDGDNGNGGNGDGENGNEMHYQDFMKCKPLNLRERKDVVGLRRSALTWWNHTEAYGISCIYHVMKKAHEAMTGSVFVPREWIQKMETTTVEYLSCNVIATEPTRLQDAVRIANNLMDEKLKGYAMKNAENKRRLEVNQRDNRGQQPPFKRPNVGGQNVARAYTAGNNERKTYNGPLPFCNKCKLHHEGPCTVRCGKCNKVGHLTRDWQGHYQSDCPKLKDQNRGNKAGNKNGVGEARGKAYVLGGGDANPDSNVVKGHPFNIDLMPVELGSFDAIIGMDWLTNHHAVIVCDEKIVWISYKDEVLIVQGDRGSRREKSKLSIISCTKTQKYVEKG
ncbi:putative reverse transcriptase domain-containing protein [Tanacetum coccineum]